MALTLLSGYPDRVGKRFIWAGVYTGPKSYATGGDPLVIPPFQSQIDSIDSSGILSVSGTYIVRAIPSVGAARATWKVKWYTAAAPQTEVTAAVDLSAEKFLLSGKGGVY